MQLFPQLAFYGFEYCFSVHILDFFSEVQMFEENIYVLSNIQRLCLKNNRNFEAAKENCSVGRNFEGFTLVDGSGMNESTHENHIHDLCLTCFSELFF